MSFEELFPIEYNCANCGSEDASGLKLCSCCSSACYCGRDWQREPHKKVHRKQCAKLKNSNELQCGLAASMMKISIGEATNFMRKKQEVGLIRRYVSPGMFLMVVALSTSSRRF